MARFQYLSFFGLARARADLLVQDPALSWVNSHRMFHRNLARELPRQNRQVLVSIPLRNPELWLLPSQSFLHLSLLLSFLPKSNCA